MQDELAEALEAAEERAREVLERVLGDRASSYTLILKIEPGGEGFRLLVDVQASRPRARWIEDLVEEAAREAVREFERRLRARKVPGKRG
ncbi:MAG: hypothetical protein GSR86_05105 [Desulfurococcales archaeon]|nr:hypothetical protein [Desulfurococcales archaeon]